MSSPVLAVDFPTFKKYALPIAMEGFPVMIRGNHGIGKSQSVYQLVDELGYDEKTNKVKYFSEQKGLVPYTVVERRVSQMTEGDLLGIPDPEGFDVNGKQASKFRPFTWLVKACTEPVILFLDELDRGIAEVRQGFFELADSRKIAGWELHPGTLIFSAINGGGEYAHRYQVNELGLAEADRWATFDLRPSVEDWLNWGKIEKNGSTNVNHLILEFIQVNHSHLEHDGDVEPGAKLPSRRSWKRLNDCLVQRGVLEQKGIDPQAIRFMGDAFVGIEAAGEFADFVANYKFQVSPEDIIDEGKWKETKGWTMNQHLSLADKMERNKSFATVLEGDRLENFCRWFITLPSEVAMKVFNALADGPQENTINVHSFVVKPEKGSRAKKKSVSDFICTLLTGTDTEH